MEKNQIKLFVVLEEHMLDRYAYVIKKNGFEGYCLKNFNNIQIGTSFINILRRIKHRSTLKVEYNKLKNRITDLQNQNVITSIYLSNSEGYIAHNVIYKLKKNFRDIELIGLQHGVFEIKAPPKKRIRKIINNLCYLFLRIFPIGVGFGEKIVDTYIVYNEKYKEFLVNELKWDEKDVIVDLKFLKAELYDKKENIKKEGTVGLFLMQCLSKANMCSKEEEKHLNEKVISYLLKKHNKVLIKTHPACAEGIKSIPDVKAQQIDNLVDAFNLCTHAYSYSSTTLLEAEIFNINTYAINSSLVKEDKAIYKIFKNVIDFDSEIDI